MEVVMKTASIILIIVVFLSAPILAVDPDELTQIKTEQLNDYLQLTPDQSEKVAGIITDYVFGLTELFENKTDDSPRLIMQDREMAEEYVTKIREVLNEDQTGKLSTLGYSVLPKPHLIMLNAALDLSPEQVAQIDAILSVYQPRIREAYDDNSSSRRRKLLKLRDLSNEQSEKIEDVLSDEQKEIYSEMREKMKQEMKARRDGRRF
jgi:hypothetical protein